MYKTPKQMWMPAEGEVGMGMMLAHAYVPWQMYDQAFSPREALIKGTLFPELYGPYKPPK
ncbi:MAG: spore coat associated protein CotJA [Sporomusaceae bacterium]|nr:spore coat associated protein CotJA [Sporomusaceae bacterium]